MSVIQRAFQNDKLIAAAEEEAAGAVGVRSERTDAQLVQCVLAGDMNAFEHLFDRHKRLVAAISARYFRRPDQIEEALQIAFAKAYGDLASFRGDNERSFASWLGRITANSCLDILRRQRRRPEDLADDLGGFEALASAAAGEPDSEGAIIGRDLAEKLLVHVNADDRALLYMLYAEEMSIAEIAAFFGWSNSKTKIRAWRARRHLRAVVKKLL
ncbi:MAG TPA: RNA polymerase sigma factor [Pyrinomonadaceae bacterium]|nr:RNA polymerase sigma factor [Pyrinomonadaceae bacterium]